MSKKRLAVSVSLFLLFCLTVAGWSRPWLLNGSSDFQYQSDVSDIADLSGQYAWYRIRYGEWPEPDKLYGCYFHIVNSEHVSGQRVDTYQNYPDTWVQFYLLDQGRIFARVTWGKHMPAAHFASNE
jgi:hypothetical protein